MRLWFQPIKSKTTKNGRFEQQATFQNCIHPWLLRAFQLFFATMKAWMHLIKHKLELLPNNPGCYLHKDKFGNIIYVGKAKICKSCA